MTKFHINAKGVPAPCRATKGNCPFGGADGTENHFDSHEEAQEQADKLMQNKYGLLYNEEKLHAGGDSWAHQDLEDGTLKVAAQVRIELEEDDFSDESKSVAAEVTDAYSSYLDKSTEEKPKSLYEFYESGGAHVSKPDRDAYHEKTGADTEKWTESSQVSFDQDFRESMDIEEDTSLMIENLEIYSRGMESTDWNKKGVNRNKAMSEFYNYVSQVYENY